MSEIPVIIGVGEFKDRPENAADALEPVALMEQAIRAASEDTGIDILPTVDSLDLVGLVTWRYVDPASQLCKMLGIKPARATNASMGGETPIRLIHEAAVRIARGEQTAALIVGGEAQYSLGRARKERAKLDWTPLASRQDAVKYAGSSYSFSNPVKKLAITDPAQIYPFYENAVQKDRGETPAEGRRNSARLWERFAKVAADNPYAWIRNAPDADRIATVDDQNRMINFPYPKFMVANPMVNQACAIIVTSLAEAEKMGVPDDRIIHIWGGASAGEPEDYLRRDSYTHSTAQAATLKYASQIVGGAENFDRLELYSCFPVVPKLTLRNLGLEGKDIAPTVAGGLSFFGGPLNNYMSHATAAMVRVLRENPGEVGLLYGQGGYLTKHHTMVLSTKTPPRPMPHDYSVQAEAEDARDEVPELVEDYDGEVTVESYTALYARDGDTWQGIVIARTPDGGRLMARVPEGDKATLEFLTSLDANPIGHVGSVRKDVFGKLTFSAQNPAPARVRKFTKVERDGPLTIVTIDRPDVMNSLDPATNAELTEIFDEFDADPDQWVAIITGAGEKAFSAGNDLKESARLTGRGAPIEIPKKGFAGITARFDCNKPIIAAVNGLAMGGGFEVALACDLIIASDNAEFALPEPRVGLAALAGGLLQLPRQIGTKHAMGMILTGRRVKAEEGVQLGFVNEVVPQAELMSAARRWADMILELSPMSIRASKDVVTRGLAEPDIAQAYAVQYKHPAVRALYRSNDVKEGPRAFVEKRKPRWSGR